MAWFKTKDGELVEVVHAVDIKEWKAAGYKEEQAPKGAKGSKGPGRPVGSTTTSTKNSDEL